MGARRHSPRSERAGGLSIQEVLKLPATIDVVTAGRALGIGRSRSYELARIGEFPCRVVAVGRTYRVPTAGLLRLLGISSDAGTNPDRGAPNPPAEPCPGPVPPTPDGSGP